MTRRLLLVFLLVLSFSAMAQAQTPTPQPPDPNANISWPPPVYVLRGEFEIRGTANLPDMSNYFIEFRPLNDDLSPEGEDELWFPATLPRQTPVQDDILGLWNTLTAPDGIYAIRLTINIQGRAPVFHEVSPVRIENNPPPWAQIDQPTATPQIVVSPTPQRRPTLAPTPTALDTQPRVVALVDANVRTGDSTLYDIVGVLLTGETAPILGLSTSNSGWYYIQLDDGRRGWIAPSIVRAEGNLASVSRINPPPPPFTPTPIPTNTPVTSANLQITGFQLLPAVPNCNEPFTVQVNVANTGSGPTASGGTLAVTDTHTASGTTTTTGTVGFPVLNPGQNFVVSVTLTVATFYNEAHQITMQVDSQNQVPETNENDNISVLTYILAKAGCP